MASNRPPPGSSVTEDFPFDGGTIVVTRATDNSMAYFDVLDANGTIIETADIVPANVTSAGVRVRLPIASSQRSVIAEAVRFARTGLRVSS